MPREAFDYQSRIPAQVIGYTAKRVRIRVWKQGQEVERWVMADSLRVPMLDEMTAIAQRLKEGGYADR